MAAPTVGTRTTPGGKILENGHPIRICFSLDPDISFKEITLTPPSALGGDPIDITTQWNSTKRTKAPRTLHDTGNASGTCAFDAAIITLIYAIINIPQTITYQYADGTKEAHYGWLQDFVRNEMSEGAMPTANYSIVHSNWDSVNDAESGPTVVDIAGT